MVSFTTYIISLVYHTKGPPLENKSGLFSLNELINEKRPFRGLEIELFGFVNMQKNVISQMIMEKVNNLKGGYSDGQDQIFFFSSYNCGNHYII